MDLETGRTSEQGRIHKITNYTVSQYILCAYCIELTQLVWDKRVIVNFMYPPLLRGPPCCKVHQSEDTKFQVGQSHDLPYGVLVQERCSNECYKILVCANFS